MGSRAIFFAIVLLMFGTVCDASFSDCGSLAGSIDAISISDCAPNARRCILRRNSNSTMEIDFTPNAASTNLTSVVHGVIAGVPVPFKLPNPNGCVDSGVECPLEAGKSYKYVTKMPILGSYPRMTLDIKWEFKGDNESEILCALIPVKIS